jgi:hypothetical protein
MVFSGLLTWIKVHAAGQVMAVILRPLVNPRPFIIGVGQWAGKRESEGQTRNQISGRWPNGKEMDVWRAWLCALARRFSVRIGRWHRAYDRGRLADTPQTA